MTRFADVPEVNGGIRELLARTQAPRYLASYYVEAEYDRVRGEWVSAGSPAGPGRRVARFPRRSPFSGFMFDSWSKGSSATLTYADLIALNFLDVQLTARAVRFLEEHEIQIARLVGSLGSPPPGFRFLDEAGLDTLEEILTLLDRGSDIGPTRASKLMARKAPDTMPILDSVVCRNLLGAIPRNGHELRQAVELLRAAYDDRSWEKAAALGSAHVDGEGRPVPPLRVLDVVAWMRWSGALAARAVRASIG